MLGKEGLRWWFGLAVVGISARKDPDRRRILPQFGDFSTNLMRTERRFPSRVAKFFFGSGFFLASDASNSQESSRTKMRPSPSGISSGCQVGLWS